MKFLSWVLGGLVGGALGAAVWAAVAHLAGVESGWIAWIVGVTTGIGVKVAAKEDQGWVPGITAALIAVGAVLGGKVAVTHLAVEKAISNRLKQGVSEPDMISLIADQVVGEFDKKGEKLDWPEGVKAPQPSEEKEYPPIVWAEATRRWNAKPLAEREAEKKAHQQHVENRLAELKPQVRERVFQKSFTAFDLLWFFLAVSSAFKLGSGITTGK